MYFLFRCPYKEENIAFVKIAFSGGAQSVGISEESAQKLYAKINDKWVCCISKNNKQNFEFVLQRLDSKSVSCLIKSDSSELLKSLKEEFLDLGDQYITVRPEEINKNELGLEMAVNAESE